MAKVAIMGFGTIGSGVLEVLRRNAQSVARRAGEAVEVKRILDIRDFSGDPDEALFTKNFEDIINDPEISVVIETIGGTKPAYGFVKAALESGRHVATSNKELVATHGGELLRIAKEHGVAFLFEASVGGGTPIITPMHQCLAANNISEVQGIVNGTTNFMLTKMDKENMDFDEALKLAQSLGYAETIDPSADIDGIDAQRKIAILSSLAFGKHIYPQNVPARGIRNVTLSDIRNGQAAGGAVRLIAWTRKDETGHIACGVEPMLVDKHNQLAGVEDVFNAVLVKGDMLGDVVFYGKGAGKLPTASAVVADVIDALKHGVQIHDSLMWEESEPAESLFTTQAPYPYYMRTDGLGREAVLRLISGARAAGEGQDVSVVTPALSPKELEEYKQKVEAAGGKVALTLKWLS